MTNLSIKALKRVPREFLESLKALPAMQMEEVPYGRSVYFDKTDVLIITIRNGLRQQILSELTSKPIVTKPKSGKEEMVQGISLAGDMKDGWYKPKDRLKELKRGFEKELTVKTKNRGREVGYFIHDFSKEATPHLSETIWQWIIKNFKPKEWA